MYMDTWVWTCVVVQSCRPLSVSGCVKTHRPLPGNSETEIGSRPRPLVLGLVQSKRWANATSSLGITCRCHDRDHVRLVAAGIRDVCL